MNWTRQRKIIAAGLATALAAGVSIVGIVVPGGGSDDPNDTLVATEAIIAYEVMAGYSIQTELPLVIRMARFEDCTEWGNCEANELVDLPIGYDEPMIPGSQFWFRVYVHNTASATMPGVMGHVYAIDKDRSILPHTFGDTVGFYDGIQGNPITESVDLGPGEEVEMWLHFAVPVLPAPGTRTFEVIFNHDL